MNKPAFLTSGSNNMLCNFIELRYYNLFYTKTITEAVMGTESI